MADIKQAAKWMQEGKRVRRKVWMLGDFFESGRADRGMIRGLPPQIHLQDLLADDWEIADV